VQVVGNLAYVADGRSGLQVLDVSNPAAPVRLGGYDTSGSAEGVQVVGNLAYVADGDSGLQVLDVSNPALPVQRAGYDTSGWAKGVQVVGTLAYVADDNAGLVVIDTSKLEALRRMGGLATGGNVRGLQVVGNRAYLANYYGGLQVIDVSNPAAPRSLGGFYDFDTGGGFSGVQVIGSVAYLAGPSGLQVIDVSNPASTRRLGGFDTGGGAMSLQVVGTRAYLANGELGLQVLGLSESRLPQSLVFSLPPTVDLTRAPIALAATASSTLPVTYRVISGPAAVVGNLLNPTNAGTVIVQAEQVGNQQFRPAPPVQREITVLAAPTPLRLSEVSMVPEGRLRFRMEGPTGGRVVLQFSPDLRAWIAVSTNTLPMALELPAISEQTTGFYRIILP
jgi:hypothetical protein